MSNTTVRRAITFSVISVLVALGAFGTGAAQFRLGTSSPFRYVIVHNEVAKAASVRQVWVLMEQEAFTKENLKTLYQLVVKRYPQPYTMNIWVFTNLDDVSAPEEADDDHGESEVKDGRPLSGAPTAVCVRNPYNEYINYFDYRPNGQGHGKIIVRGPEKQKSN